MNFTSNQKKVNSYTVEIVYVMYKIQFVAFTSRLALDVNAVGDKFCDFEQ